MRVGHLVADAGVAGDMLLGALVDAGAPLERLRQAVAALDVGLDLSARQVQVGGVRATKVDVALPAGGPRLRTLADAEASLDAAALPGEVDRPARAAFRALARAEGEVHGRPAEDVIFHELGSLDTAADVVGACAGVAALGLQRLTCGPVAVGGGQVVTAHGHLAVPAPAVTALLRGFVVHGGGDGELATPTGAALLAVLAEPVEGVPLLRLRGSGRGSGDPDRPRPSALTLLVGDHTGEAGPGEPATVLEATVDDLPGELVPGVLDALREAGAHDAWAVPAAMKKGRPGHTLTALAGEAELPRLIEVLVTEAGTLGVRWHQVRKQPLPRRWLDVEVGGEPVRVKVGQLHGRPVVVAAEHADVQRAAARLSRPAREIHAEAVSAGRRMLDAPTK